ncbi:DNA-binding PadR family transcriptional regulator [Actinoplanes lutulentus]|uniref:DNA-binding PadR family transcriptional regulator n=1 Tax=Actinoplanes lutulentus TaxID=1287878 RepID=A0A327ZI52_9ACTN|nr:PadR family transcriptional regulator [Actinoplanes lutulentus]MBB2948010.1 DNA-binding PadR family transcriptional regulator [Actinoplanes lutulentus]RAK40109.1 DNA-binding PadR family transcriptional regulator [Actinoplanes lutulentus]
MPLDASRNSLVLPILGLLAERPAHAYDLAGRLRERCGHLPVTRSTVATLLKSMARAGLVTAREPGRVGNRPPRTVYETTPAGVTGFHDKVEAGLRDAPAASMDFVLALGYAEVLAAERTALILEDRAARLLASGDAPGRGPLENEYWRGMVTAEIEWITGLARRIRSGELAWNEAGGPDQGRSND